MVRHTLKTVSPDLVLLCYSITDVFSLYDLTRVWMPFVEEVSTGKSVRFVVVGCKADAKSDIVPLLDMMNASLSDSISPVRFEDGVSLVNDFALSVVETSAIRDEANWKKFEDELEYWAFATQKKKKKEEKKCTVS